MVGSKDALFLLQSQSRFPKAFQNGTQPRVVLFNGFASDQCVIHIRLNSRNPSEKGIHETFKYRYRCRHPELQAAGPKKSTMSIYGKQLCSLVIQHKLLISLFEIKLSKNHSAC
ncbi:hypothetical protein AAFF_G00354700 [Aldrovandia affinis]|uniref:Uncharacterized protein n=1 Tax=Aldrovandia affinis TaxID=143900 RepID=A0AAD7SIR9_9TELE|nr:hypothetical protein AAFF_G00354700 [Aldrovandia affinis]